MMLARSECGGCRAGALVGLLAFWLATLAGGTAPAQEEAERPPWIQLFEQMHDDWTHETPEERLALESIEISFDEERRVGAERLAAFRSMLASQEMELIEKGAEVDYLRSLIRTLIPHLTHRRRYPSIDVYLVPSDDTEAGALPGGTLIVTRGLLDYAGSEAALVGVLAHELSHIDRGHQLEDVRRLKKMEQTMQRGDFHSADWATMGMGWAKRFARPFRPDQEAQADDDATRWTWQAGYDPRQMAELFDRLQQRDQHQLKAPMPSFLRSHPDHWQRSRAIRQASEQLARQKPRKKLYVGRENLERRIPRDERRFEERIPRP